MGNLLTETKEALKAAGVRHKDVRWVGSRDGAYSCSWEDFGKIANKRYDDGYGAAHVASDLVVVGDGWWLERYEYDGSEQWDYKTVPRLTEKPLPLSSAVDSSAMWPTVRELHGVER